MQEISITLPDGSTQKVPKGTSALEVAERIGKRLARDAVAAEVDGRVVDVYLPLERDCRLRILTPRDEEALEIFRHTASHLLAHAVTELFPGVRIGIGPVIDEGFYYDFDKGTPFTAEDLERIEEKMAELVRADFPVRRVEMPKDEAIAYFKKLGDTLKVEIIEEKAEGDTASCYKQDSFMDFCRGPHLPSTGKVGAFKLLSVAGAYWRGDERNPMLQRIYGTAFATRRELDEHLQRLEEAKKRDHIKLGKRLGLFSVHEEAGAGLVFWHPRGAFVRERIEAFLKEEHRLRGYDLVYTPHIARGELWKTSGHYEFFKENMYFFEQDEEEYVIKPMNCPGHILMYQTSMKSYRELPVRTAELGTVYRCERSGVLHGMLRVRGFTQDDAHIFCTPEQVEEEIGGVLDLLERILKTFGFSEYAVDLSTWDPGHRESYAGTAEGWALAEEALVKALRRKGWDFARKEGEAAFYGPKIDVQLVDAIGRKWQCSTVQFDFNLPRRFDVTYVGADSKRHHVFMIHRALLGSLERFVGMLIEHHAGAFPLWLCAEQARVLPVTDRSLEYAEALRREFAEAGLRATVDSRGDKIGAKIRDAEMDKIPVMLIVGDKEAAARTVSVRARGQGDLGTKPCGEVKARLLELERTRSLAVSF
ncbi:MAG: threonine--tRNA ligase [Acidobacteriota bacterium]|nr:MAG: threonine--tRNA ligase [Acidobacteriota bacterium]